MAEKKTGMNKNLAENYRKLNVNVKKSTYAIWKEYADSKGMSMYALVHQLFTEAMKKDGFSFEEESEENSAE